MYELGNATSTSPCICYSQNCPLTRECANHDTAGDFRSEGGSTPKLELIGDKVICHQEVYDGTFRGFSFLKDGRFWNDNGLEIVPISGSLPKLKDILRAALDTEDLNSINNFLHEALAEIRGLLAKTSTEGNEYDA